MQSTTDKFMVLLYGYGSLNLPDTGYLPHTRYYLPHTRYPAGYPVDPDIQYSPIDRDVNKDLGFKAKDKAKDLGFKAKAKDLSFKAKTKAKDLSFKAKDLTQGLESRPRT